MRNKVLLYTVVLSLLLVAALTLRSRLEIVRLPPDAISSPEIAFYAIGDQGNGWTNQVAVSDAMNRLAEREGDLSFVALLGDNFYARDKITTASLEWLLGFEYMYAGKGLGGVPFFAVLGNHDYRHPRADGGETPIDAFAQIDYSRQALGSNRWKMPDHYFARDFGRHGGRALLKVVFVDTNLQGKALEQQADFIRRQFLEESGNPLWRIVIGHQTIASYGRHYGDRSDAASSLLSAMKDSGVDLYIAGHDHNQQLISRPGEPVYVVSGAGGRNLYKQEKSGRDLKFFRADYGFARIKADPGQLLIGFFDTGANEVGAFRIAHGCRKSPPADCVEAR